MAKPQNKEAWLRAINFILKVDPDARFRLHDILPEEVSLVDRAANKRRFITVKQEKGVHTMPALFTKKIPAAARQEMDNALTAALEKLVNLNEAISKAEETTEASEKPMPGEAAVEIKDIVVQLNDLLVKFPNEVEKGDPISALGTEASDKLKAMAAIMAEIAEAGGPDEVADIMGRLFGVDKNAEPTEENAKKLQKLLDAVKVLMPKQEEATPAEKKEDVKPEDKKEDAAPAATEKKEETPAEPAATEKKEDAKPEDKPTAQEPAATEKKDEASADKDVVGDIDESDSEILSKSAEYVSGLITAVAKKGAKMSSKRLATLRGAIKTLSALVEEISPADVAQKSADEILANNEQKPNAIGSIGTGGSPEDKSVADAMKDDPTNILAPVMKRMESMEKQISSLLKTPEAPASRQEEVGAGKVSPDSRSNDRPNKWIY